MFFTEEAIADYHELGSLESWLPWTNVEVNCLYLTCTSFKQDRRYPGTPDSNIQIDRRGFLFDCKGQSVVSGLFGLEEVFLPQIQFIRTGKFCQLYTLGEKEDFQYHWVSEKWIYCWNRLMYGSDWNFIYIWLVQFHFRQPD